MGAEVDEERELFSNLSVAMDSVRSHADDEAWARGAVLAVLHIDGICGQNWNRGGDGNGNIVACNIPVGAFLSFISRTAGCSGAPVS